MTTYVITDPCVAVCDTACVEVCPTDAIHGPLPLDALRAMPPSARPQMFIDPAACIYCGCCEPECPVQAIYAEEDVPPQYADSPERNAAFFRGK